MAFDGSYFDLRGLPLETVPLEFYRARSLPGFIDVLLSSDNMASMFSVLL